LVLAAATAGKALFVEKPLGLGAGDAGRMADAIERAGVLFQTGFFMRGQPINRFLREQIAAGSFGQLTRLRITNCHSGAINGLFDGEWRWMADPRIAGVGGFGDLGVHALDLLLWFLDGQATLERGTARIGAATGRYADCDEYGEGLIAFSGGLTGSIAAGWADPSSRVSIEIAGRAATPPSSTTTSSSRAPQSPGPMASAPGRRCRRGCPMPSTSTSTP
jgi:predicted dehydrogenase